MKIVIVAAACLFSAASAASATRLSAQDTGRPPGTRGMRPPSHGRAGNGNDDQHRNALEQEFRQRSEAIVRKRLNLNDDQVTRLRSVNADIGGKRNALVEEERTVRSGLRDEMSRGNSADQGKVSQLMDQVHDLQNRRFSLQQDEQRQLSGFLSPVQVAQYVGLQAQIRQRIREMQRGQRGGKPNPDH